MRNNTNFIIYEETTDYAKIVQELKRENLTIFKLYSFYKFENYTFITFSQMLFRLYNIIIIYHFLNVDKQIEIIVPSIPACILRMIKNSGLSPTFNKGDRKTVMESLFVDFFFAKNNKK